LPELSFRIIDPSLEAPPFSREYVAGAKVPERVLAMFYDIHGWCWTASARPLRKQTRKGLTLPPAVLESMIWNRDRTPANLSTGLHRDSGKDIAATLSPAPRWPL